MAPLVSPRSAVPPISAAPTMEELCAEYNRHLEEMVSLEVKAKQLAEKEEAEAKEAQRQGIVARWVEAKWRKAVEHSVRVEEESVFLYKKAKGAKRIAAAWRYQGKVYSATESEIDYTPTKYDKLVA